MRSIVIIKNSPLISRLNKIPEDCLDILALINEGSDDIKKIKRDCPVLEEAECFSKFHPDQYDYIIIFSEEFSSIAKKIINTYNIPKEKIAGPSVFYLLPYLSYLTDDQFKKIVAVKKWYHIFEILPNVMSPGYCIYKPWLLEDKSIQDLHGKNCLDIGAWDGPYTLEMYRRGATVTAFDIQPPNCSGFNTMLELTQCKAKHICENVYNLNKKDHGTFDLVTFFGVYYHLKNPLLAFENIYDVLEDNGILLVEGAALESAPTVDAYWSQHKSLLESVKNYPVAIFAKDCYQNVDSNWWIPSMRCLIDMVESCGFTVEENKFVENGIRIYLKCRKNKIIPKEHDVLS